MHIWAAIISLLFVLPASAASVYKCKNPAGAFLYQEKPCADETQPVSSWQAHSDSDVETDSADPSGKNAFIIGPGRNGHYFVDGAINDHFLNFVIDTGASLVSIPLSFATSTGLRCQRLAAIQTGNGVSNACYVTIQKLSFGHFTLRNVEALVAPNLSQPLLGMNVLKRFNVEQKNGQMSLSKQY